MEKQEKTKIVFNWTNIFTIIPIVLACVAVILLLMTRTPAEQEIVIDDPEVIAGQKGGVAEMKMEDLVVGEGEEAVAGKKVTVHYIGTLTDGTKFDSSVDRGQPFEFNLGAGQVIQGWDQGVAGMKVGGKRKLTIPPELGYGDRDMGDIPPNSTLVFEVELLGVE